MKKRVLFISPLPPPHYGSAVSSKECLEILKKSKDFEVKNIKLNYSKDMDDVGKINISKILGIRIVAKQIKEQIKEFNPDLIYFMPALARIGLYRDFYFIKIIKKLYSKRILFHVRERIVDFDWENKTHRKMYRGMFSNQKAIVLGEAQKKDLHNLIPDEDIIVLPNAIRNEASAREIKRIINKRKENSRLEVLFSSNMDKTKGWPKLLEACKILGQKKINFNCHFVGAWQNKEDRKIFYEFVKKNNFKGKIFSHGRKTGEEWNNFFKRADVFVFPTEYKPETFGRVIIEAMMFALPVIANGIAA
ncbi:MAG: glycosyltransferase family 4 protein, partial [Nanoarchaeota archaeon]